MRSYRFSIVTILLSAICYAQSPGNIAADLQLWLRADAGVTGTNPITAILDQSGNNHHPTVSGTTGGVVYNAPDLTANAINFNPAITFSQNIPEGLNLSTHAAAIAGSKDITVYFVGRPNDVADLNVGFYLTNTLGGSDRDANGSQGNILEHYITINNDGTTAAGHQDGLNPTFILTNSGTADFNPKIITSAWVPGSRFTNSQDGANFPASLVPTNTLAVSNIFIGSHASNGNNSRRFDGDIAEVIIYDADNSTTINSKRRIESYLALKYGITLNEGGSDYFATDLSVIWDQSVNFDQRFNVFGIGRDNDSSLNQEISKSVYPGSILTLSTDNDFTSTNGSHANIADDRDFFIIGNNDGDTNVGPALTSLSPALFRINRVWKTQDTGSLGCLHYRFDTSGFTTGPTQNWFILIADDANFSTALSIRPITVGGNVDVLMNLDNNTSNYITLARLDSSVNTTPINLQTGVVGINTANPTNNTYIDIRGGNRGMVVSRLNQTSINALTPVEGMVVFNITTLTFQLYNGMAWRDFGNTALNTKFCN